MNGFVRACGLAVAAVMLVGSTGAMGADPSAADGGPAAPQSSEDDFAEATKFRETFGFDATDTTVRLAAADPEVYPDREWGVPLSVEEAAEMQRRLEVMHAVHPAVLAAYELPSWGGWWIDQRDRGTPVLQFAADPASAVAGIKDLMPAGVVVRLIQVPRPLSDLEAEQTAITDARFTLREQGVHVTGVTVDVKGNRVVVSVNTSLERATDVIQREFGTHVAVVTRGTAVSDACPASGCLPVKGGIGITDQVDNWPCTTGFLARRTDGPDSLVFITAGHCVKLGSSSNPPWEHGENNIGWSLQIGGDLVHTWRDNSNADVGVVTVTSADIPTVKNKLLTDQDPVVERPLEVRLAWELQAPGTPACRMGLNHGRHCGEVVDMNDNRESEVENEGSKTILGVVVYDVDAEGGDSGGPTFYVFTPSVGNKYAVLLGTHVHSDDGYSAANGLGWYSPWDRGIDTLESEYPGLNLEVCTTAACGF